MTNHKASTLVATLCILTEAFTLVIHTCMWRCTVTIMAFYTDLISLHVLSGIYHTFPINPVYVFLFFADVGEKSELVRRMDS